MTMPDTVFICSVCFIAMVEEEISVDDDDVKRCDNCGESDTFNKYEKVAKIKVTQLLEAGDSDADDTFYER